MDLDFGTLWAQKSFGPTSVSFGPTPVLPRQNINLQQGPKEFCGHRVSKSRSKGSWICGSGGAGAARQQAWGALHWRARGGVQGPQQTGQCNQKPCKASYTGEEICPLVLLKCFVTSKNHQRTKNTNGQTSPTNDNTNGRKASTSRNTNGRQQSMEENFDGLQNKNPTTQPTNTHTHTHQWTKARTDRCCQNTEH